MWEISNKSLYDVITPFPRIDVHAPKINKSKIKTREGVEGALKCLIRWIMILRAEGTYWLA